MYKVNTAPRGKNDIQWNFTKFLIGRDGEIAARFEPMTNLKKVKAAVEAAL